MTPSLPHIPPRLPQTAAPQQQLAARSRQHVVSVAARKAAGKAAAQQAYICLDCGC